MNRAEMEEVVRIFNNYAEKDNKKKMAAFIRWFDHEVAPMENEIKRLNEIINNSDKAIASLTDQVQRLQHDFEMERERAKMERERAKMERERAQMIKRKLDIARKINNVR